MTTITLYCRGGLARAKVEGPVTAGMAGIQVKVECDSAWAGLTKTLKARCAQVVYRVSLDEAGTGTLPFECLIGGQRLECGLDGLDETGTLRIPTNWAFCALVKPSVADWEGEDAVSGAVEKLAARLEAAEGKLADITQQLPPRLEAAEEEISKIKEGAGQQAAGSAVYCWGDSLTEGVGGWMKTPENVQYSIVSSYPDEVAKRYPCVNLGCRGETIQTIMARQGSDPMVVGGFTIPAEAGADVVVGYLRGNYFSENRLGIPTASGDLAQPLAESEAGINPCAIAGVEGELFRDMESDSQGRFAYRFRRAQSGQAVPVPEGTQLETYAMKHYRGGVAVIWMGANGAVNSHTAYIQKLKQMIAYGNYSNYLVLIAREYTAQWVLEDTNSIQKALTDENGVCHLLYLPPHLAARGYTLAGIGASGGVPDTSGWATTDELLKKAPLLMYSYGGNQEENFESLHFSCYGYKAIGRLVTEQLGKLLGAQPGGNEPEPEPGYETDGEDEFGAFAYKLTKPMTGTGNAVNTNVKLYDTEKDWTICCRFRADMTVSDGALGCVFEGRKFFDADSVQTAAFLRLLPQTDGSMEYSFAGGFGGFNFPFDNNSGYTAPTDGYHTAVIAKQGGNYWFYLDGSLAYNCALGYQVTEDHLHEEPLYLFGRVENGTEYNTVCGVIDDFRVYTDFMDTQSVTALLAQMNS